MRSSFVLPALVCATSILFVQNSAPSNSQPGQDPASAPCVVAGRVVTAADGNPVKSARIALMPEHERSHTQIYAATSDNDRHFVIKNVPS